MKRIGISIIHILLVLLLVGTASLVMTTNTAYAADDISASFTDTNFKQAVWEWLGNETTPPGVFTKEDLTNRMAAKENILDVCSRNINSLNGLENFEGTGLKELICNDNRINELPTLPTSLTKLDCSVNNLLALPPTLPINLTVLYCDENQLPELYVLPQGLTELHCSNNLLTNLPELPGTLTNLGCGYNRLTSLPVLPEGLEGIYCRYNQITSLPNLPGTLKNLDCCNNQLTSLPTLPANLNGLICSSNELSQLPDLPSKLTILLASSAHLTSLPVLPDSLFILDCSKNNLYTLPSLPENLMGISCTDNKLRILPELPAGLKILICDNNHLISFPTSLPAELITFDIRGNYLNVFSDPLKSLLENSTALSKKYLPQLKYIYPGEEIGLFPGQNISLSTLSFEEQINSGSGWGNMAIQDYDIFNFYSSDESVAAVDSNGTITAKTTGNCVIYGFFQGLDSEYTRVIVPLRVLDPDYPDLKVEMLNPPEDIGVGTRVRLVARVTNAGGAETPRASLEVYIGNTRVATRNVSKLKSGETRVLTNVFKIPADVPFGSGILKVMVKPSVPIEENNQNNTYWCETNIVRPDLTINLVEPKSNLGPGKSVILSVEIANLQNAPAGKFVVRVYYRDTEITLGEKKVPGLKVGTKTFNIRVKLPADYDQNQGWLRLIADADDTVAEQNEENNTKSYGRLP